MYVLPQAQCQLHTYLPLVFEGRLGIYVLPQAQCQLHTYLPLVFEGRLGIHVPDADEVRPNDQTS